MVATYRIAVTFGLMIFFVSSQRAVAERIALHCTFDDGRKIDWEISELHVAYDGIDAWPVVVSITANYISWDYVFREELTRDKVKIDRRTGVVHWESERLVEKTKQNSAGTCQPIDSSRRHF